MGMLEWVFGDRPPWRQPARIREDTLESDNLFSGIWIPPQNIKIIYFI